MMDGAQFGHVEPADSSAPTEAEVQLMKGDLVNNMRSIQELIAYYQTSQQTLQDEVAEFILRDLDEQNKMNAIALEVRHREERALGDPAYVRWAAVKKSECPEAEGPTSWYMNLDPAYCPYAFVHLTEAVVQVLAGWRSSTGSTLVEDTARKLLTSTESHEPMVVFLNGWALLSVACTDSNVLEFDELRKFLDCGTIDALYKHWRRYVLEKSSVTDCAGIVNLLSKEELVTGLQSDGLDCLTAVPLALVAEGVMVRGFAFHGCVKVVESLGPQHINVLSAYFTNVEDARSRVLHSFCCAVTEHFKDKKSVAVTALITSTRFIIIDVRDLGPNLCFDSFLSWADVCGVARLETSAPVMKTMMYTSSCTIDAHDRPSKYWPLLSVRTELVPQSRGKQRSYRDYQVPLLVAAAAISIAVIALKQIKTRSIQ